MMHRIRAKQTWIVVLLLGAAVVLAARSTAQPTTPAPALAQSGRVLDTPLLAANFCGAGTAGDTHYTFAATGDTFPHATIQAAAEQQGYNRLFEQVRPFLEAADFAFTNFDGAMLEGSPYTGYPAFNYNPELATALKNGGIRLVSTANNHILDRGPQGIDATLEQFDRVGIAHHGAVATWNSDQPHPPYLPITLSRDGVSITIGFLAFTWGTNGIPDPYNQVNLLWESNIYGQQGMVRQSVLDAIAQAQRETDLVIVATHWGYEYQFAPDAAQREGAVKMAEAGADVILGAQPHTLQPVDIIETNGRKTLVAYSLANFIADQSAFQATYFTDTSVIFYVGIVRRADGSVQLGGYRYLPTMMVERTRPAPVPAAGHDHLHQHVRQMMRDPHGLRQIDPTPPPPGIHIEVCPRITFPGVAGVSSIGGDFVQHFATLGSGTEPRPLGEALMVFGYPTTPVVHELTGDCQKRTSVLYTERQRLELHPGRSWPYRVIGTQLGTEIYRQRYGVEEVERHREVENTAGASAFANEAFRAFYHTYGGTTVFGYPISGELVETNERTGQQRRVQYFERARFELVPGTAPEASLFEQVHLGLLGREYAGIEQQCNLAPTATPAPPPAPTSPPAPPAATAPADGAALRWIWALAAALSFVLLVLLFGWVALRAARAHARG